MNIKVSVIWAGPPKYPFELLPHKIIPCLSYHNVKKVGTIESFVVDDKQDIGMLIHLFTLSNS